MKPIDNVNPSPFYIAGVGALGGLIAGQFCKYNIPVTWTPRLRRILGR